MPSIIEGHNYDIFISYRQKDNKHDGWVTEFVNMLKGDLEATFKEDISIYFDENPHDGLLETHSVDKSLEDKLRCLIFIPVISQTYCDPKSFAWQYEFCAFNKLAKEDRFGRDIKLASGNVAGRILPVKIHDLDPEDKTLLETELDGVLRGIEFIYKEPGVNRPLTPKDSEDRNTNKTNYRNQINKVANAVKEIITALKKQGQQPEEESHEVRKPVSNPQKNHKTTIITGSIIALLLIILGVLFIPKLFKPIEKSIAVLPFINDSPDAGEENIPFVNGLMEEILISLQTIKEFRVPGRTSVEQYRNVFDKSVIEKARELNVNYIVEGSVQKYENRFRLRVQLIRAKRKETHLWANSYEQEINSTKDIFNIQSEIAQAIAAELKAVITPEEKQQIEKLPTTNLTALNFYQKGREEEGRFPYYDITESDATLLGLNPSAEQSVRRAEKMYKTALEYDSTFSMAYTALAGIYWRKNYYKEYFSGSFLDSVLKLTNRALYFDDKLPDAYSIRGMYYGTIGDDKQASDDFDKAIKLNPNYWFAYYGKGNYSDNAEALENFLQAAYLHPGAGLSTIFNKISFILSNHGFRDLAEKYSLKAVKLESDSTSYYFWLYMYEFEYNKCYEFYTKKYLRDSTDLQTVEFLALYYQSVDQSMEALKFFKKWFDILKAEGRLNINSIQRVGYAYSKNGIKDSAEYYFNKQIEYCDEVIRLNRGYGSSGAVYYDLAGVYAYRGDKIKAYENLRRFIQIPRINLWLVRYINYDPLFDGIRKEPEFQNILNEMNVKYQAEHERVRKWLEENNML